VTTTVENCSAEEAQALRPVEQLEELHDRRSVPTAALDDPVPIRNRDSSEHLHLWVAEESKRQRLNGCHIGRQVGRSDVGFRKSSESGETQFLTVLRYVHARPVKYVVVLNPKDQEDSPFFVAEMYQLSWI
jgi:hypothetical protein